MDYIKKAIYGPDPKEQVCITVSRKEKEPIN